MKGIAPALIAASLLALVADASAQDLTRRQFAFFERHLAIEVASGAAGAVHIVRGMPGRLEVRGRSDGGFAGFGLAGHTRDRLNLAPVGAGRTEYLVVVPEHVRVRVRLPEGVVDIPTTEPATTLEWGGTRPGASGVGPYSAAPDGYAPYAGNGVSANGARAYAAPAYAGFGAYAPATPVAIPLGSVLAYHVEPAAAPRLLTLIDDATIRRLEIRTGGDEFAIVASRQLALTPGSAAHLELRLGREPLDLVIHVPAGATFEIRTAYGAILDVRDGRGATACNGVTVQRRGGAERYTFATAEGEPLCR
jgi:hypothetical protein